MADAYHTSTTDALFIPEVWSKEVMLARESVLVLANLVRRFDVEVASYGDILHVPLVTNISAGNISTSTGVIDSVVNTDSNVDITIDKWKGTVINVLDIVNAQSKYDIFGIMTKKIAYSLGVIIEQDLAILAASLSQTYGTFNTALTDANFRSAVQALDDSRTPMSDRHLLIKPAVKNTLLSLDRFVRYDAIAYGKGESPILKGNVGEIYGVAVHVSPETYKTSNDTSNMMFHRDCFGLAIQKGVKMEEFARTAFTRRMGGSELYGVKEMRDDQGVELRS